ncbi:MAG: response regulator, partial [Rhizobacter sp.]
IQPDPSASRRLRDALGGDARFSVCASVATLAEARRVLATRTPDLLISDLRLPDGAFHVLLRELRPGRSHRLVTTASLHDPHLMHALRSGADGFMLSGRSTEAMLNVVRLTLAGGSPIAPEIARHVLALCDVLNARPVHVGGARTTPLERSDRQLLEWTSEGYLPHEIARGLDVSIAEVGQRVRALYRRIQFEPPAARPLRRAA